MRKNELHRFWIQRRTQKAKLLYYYPVLIQLERIANQLSG